MTDVAELLKGVDAETRRICEGYGGRNFDKPHEVEHGVFCAYGEDWSVDNFLKEIIDAIAKIPESKRAGAVVQLGGEYGESPSLKITYRGLESAEAVADRVRRCLAHAEKRKAEERATYEALKRKFGGAADG